MMMRRTRRSNKHTHNNNENNNNNNNYLTEDMAERGDLPCQGHGRAVGISVSGIFMSGISVSGISTQCSFLTTLTTLTSINIAAAGAVDRELLYIGCARAILRAGPGRERPGIEKSTVFN